MDLAQALAFCQALSVATLDGFFADLGVHRGHLGAALPHHAPDG